VRTKKGRTILFWHRRKRGGEYVDRLVFRRRGGISISNDTTGVLTCPSALGVGHGRPPRVVVVWSVFGLGARWDGRGRRYRVGGARTGG